MMVDKFYILIAEGVTDCSLLEAVLEKYLSFIPYEKIDELPLVFREMIGTYPTISGELKRQDSPTFYYKDSIAIAVKQAGGCGKIANRASALVEVIDKLEAYAQFGGFLIFSDTDEKSREEIIRIFKAQFSEHDLVYEGNRLEVYGNSINCKVHLFPDDGCGAIEKLLLECAQISYKNVAKEAFEYRMAFMDSKYDEVREKCWAKKAEIQEFYADKVQYGAISTVLKPDRPVRFSIKDMLIRSQYFDLYMKLPEFKKLYDFLRLNIV